MTEQANKGHVYLAVPPIGGGKETFAQIGADALRSRDMQVTFVRPEQEGLLAKGAWTLLNGLYMRAGRPGRVQDWFYGKARDGNGIASYLLNGGIVRRIRDKKLDVLTTSATLAQGVDHRHVYQGDYPPEKLAADDQTTSYVTLPESAKRLIELGAQEEDVDVVGFMVPDILRKNERKRRRERLDKFESFEHGVLTPDNPLRLAFMTTGQYQHMDYLKEYVLEDSLINQWIKEGKVKLTVYAWKSKLKAHDIYSHAKKLGLDAELTTEYHSKSEDPELEAGVKIFYHSDPEIAVRTSFEIANDADIMLTVLAERLGWTRYVPTIALDPGDKNANMIENTVWARSMGLAGEESEATSLGQTIRDQLRDQYSRLRNYYCIGEGVKIHIAQEVGENSFDVYDGANNVADNMLASTG